MNKEQDHERALIRAATLAQIAQGLLKEAAENVRSTSPPGICIGGTLRSINYYLCQTASDAERMSSWLMDHIDGHNKFCEHGQPPHIVKAALCRGCQRDQSKELLKPRPERTFKPDDKLAKFTKAWIDYHK